MTLSSSNFKALLANIRHDLKTPVGHILGYSEMLAEDLENDPWDEFKQDLEKIHSSGNKLLTLIEDLLGASKTKVDDIDIVNVEYQLRMQLNHITGYCEMLQELAEEENRTEFNIDLNHINEASKNFTNILADKVTISALSAEILPSQEKLMLVGNTELSNPERVLFSSLGEGGNILIVDDNAANLELLTRRLTRNGYHTQAVNSGAKALELLKSQSVDLILLDLVMPEMNGFEVLTQLKNNHRLRNIPVIILSAHDDMDQIVQCILLGADDYIFKPFNPVLLKARIVASLEKFRLRQNQVPRLEVFISSPGDVIPERKVIRGIINDLNEELSDRVRISPVFWEDEPLLASDTFQAQIHPAKNSDIYLGIFWSRLGSPLPESITREDGSLYDSGSEYEYEDAYYGYQKTGKPEILVYRKMSEAFVSLSNKERVLSSIEQFEKVDKFIERWFIDPVDGSYSGAYHCFEQLEYFEDMVYKHLKKLVLQQLETNH
jgi:CheY-like chemotaxis protein